MFAGGLHLSVTAPLSTLARNRRGFPGADTCVAPGESPEPSLYSSCCAGAVVAVAVGVGVSVGVAVGPGAVVCAVAVGVGVGAGVSVGAGVAVGVSVGVAVGAGVSVGVAVAAGTVADAKSCCQSLVSSAAFTARMV